MPTNTVEVRPGFILQCRGPQPENPHTDGIEVRVGLSIPAEGGVRTITCSYIVVDPESFLPRCNMLNALGIPSNPQDKDIEGIIGMVSDSKVVYRTSNKLPKTIVEGTPVNQVPTQLDITQLPICRLAMLVVV